MTKKEKQMTGIEPASSAWEADILPMNYICLYRNMIYYTINFLFGKQNFPSSGKMFRQLLCRIGAVSPLTAPC